MDIAVSEVIRSGRRTLSIEVKEDAEIIVRAPYRIPERDIKAFVEKKRPWIERSREKALRKHSQRPQREFIDGEDFLYLGKYYKLKVQHGRDRALVFDDAFTLSPDHAARAHEFFTDWYKDAARSVIKERAGMYATASSLRYSGIKITSARRTWGSCTRRGTLNFSWRIAMAPVEVIDYVIVHELAHLAEMNHSKRFWAKVGEIFPGYKEQRSWLRDNAHLLTL